MEAAAPGQLKRPVVWVERVGWLDVLPLAALAWSGRELRYDENATAGPAPRLLSALAPAGSFRPAGLTLAAQDERGEALNYRLEDELEQAAQAYIDAERPGWSRFERRMAKAFVSEALLFRMTFIVMARHAARREGFEARDFYLVRHPANEALRRRFPELRLRSSPSPRGLIRSVGIPAALIARCLLRAVRGPRVDASPELGKRRAVWVEYYPDDVDGYISRAFWRSGLSERFEKVFYVDRRDTDCGPETRAKISGAGFGWIDMRRPWETARVSPSRLAQAVCRFFGRLGTGSLWLSWFELEADLWTELWSEVFKRFRVGALFQHQDFDWRQGVQARGLERAGGVMVGVHWAECPFITEPAHMTPMQVFLAWGANQAARLEGKGHECRHVLPTGLWITGDARDELALKEKLGGAEFSLAVFDSSAAYNIFQSVDQLADFLLGVLSRLDERPTWRGLLKPKSSPDYSRLPGGARINALIERLSREGRLFVVDRKVSPISVGRAAGFSAGFMLNSAVILGGCRGARGVCWDSAGWSRHPLYRVPSQKVIYRDLPQMLAAVDAAAAGDRTAGDWSAFAAGIDAFGDERAPERAAGLLNDLLTRQDAGDGSNAALDAAAAAYRERWGVRPDWAAREWWQPATPAR